MPGGGGRVEVLISVEFGQLGLELVGRGTRQNREHAADRHRYESAVDVAPE